MTMFPGKKALALAATSVCMACAATDVTFLMCYRPDHPEDPATKQILSFTARRPEIRPFQWGGLTLPGAGGRATFMLALAGGTAPDVYKAWFHILRHDVEEGFCYPLNEWLGEDADGDGRLSDAEAKWPGWKDVPQLWRDVATKDGKVYAVPTPGFAYYGIVYRKDLVKAAGLDPEAPPRTWNEFAGWCERLTFRDKTIAGAKLQRGQRAFGIENRPWGFLPWVGAAGGDVVRIKNEKLRMKNEELRGKNEESRGERGSRSVARDSQEGHREPRATNWEACFDSPECLRAADFLHTLITNGVVRALPQLSLSNEIADLFVQGEIVSVFGGEDLVTYLTESLNFPAEQIGLMPFPAADGNCRPVLQAHKHFYAITEGVGRRPKEERDDVWACVNELTSAAVYDETVRKNVAEGRARWCLPSDLKRLGFNEHLAEVPPGIRKMYDDLEAGRIRAVTEPSVGFWQAASDLVSRRFLGILLSDAGKDFDYRAALKSITDDANRGLMFDGDRAKASSRPRHPGHRGDHSHSMRLAGLRRWCRSPAVECRSGKRTKGRSGRRHTLQAKPPIFNSLALSFACDCVHRAVELLASHTRRGDGVPGLPHCWERRVAGTGQLHPRGVRPRLLEGVGPHAAVRRHHARSRIRDARRAGASPHGDSAREDILPHSLLPAAPHERARDNAALEDDVRPYGERNAEPAARVLRNRAAGVAAGSGVGHDVLHPAGRVGWRRHG